MNNLRDFLYLDSNKLHSFVAQINGGFIKEVTETTRQLGGISAGLNVGVLPIGGKIDASKNKESESKKSILLTDPAYFDILYRYLQKEKSLKTPFDLPQKSLHNLKIGEFVEINGFAQPPVVENWIKKIKEIYTFLLKNMSLVSSSQSSKSKFASKQLLSQFKQIIDLLTDFINISRKDPGREFIQVDLENVNLKVWCGLLPEFFFGQMGVLLPSNVTVFGRVERLLQPDEIWKVVDLEQFSQNFQATELLSALNGLSSITGKQIVVEELQAKYPDFFISPVAIYQ
ncbi:MAG: hypothetical protein GX432_03745 [Candidatus Atribacteria bacterium]|nr:hypothetical protein [Candidatus Atribacteria bacterium]